MSMVPMFTTLRGGERINLSTEFSLLSLDDGDDDDLPGPSTGRRGSGGAMARYAEHYKTSKINVPEAVFEDFGEPGKDSYKVPSKYITYEIQKQDYDKVIEYDCDEEDYEWLSEITKFRKENKHGPVAQETFELVMDRLEKESRFEPKSSALAPGGDSDDVCCVCGDGEDANANQIVYCDMCNIAVHQECYGVPYIPEGSWLCRRCKLSPSQSVVCELCPSPYGAFKQTSEGKWAHVVCAIWLNEVSFANVTFLEPIEGVKNSLSRRRTLRCLLCRKKEGACIQCSSRQCVKSFHVTCAQKMGLVMQVVPISGSGEGDDFDVERFVYCHQHSNNNKMSKKDIDESIRRARRNMATYQAYKPTINMPTITVDAMNRVKDRAGTADIDDIVEYWYLKRRSRCGVPLIRRLQVENGSPLQILQPKTQRVVVSDMNEESQKTYNDFRRMRYSLETARLLSEQIKKRDILKRNHLRVSCEIFEKSMLPPSVIINETIEKLAKKDSKMVFAEPVTLEGYNLVIKQPMDFLAIRKRSKNFKYASLSELRKDITLMCDNCEKFNHDNEYYLQYGKKYRKAATLILDTADEYQKNVDEIQRKIITEEEMSRNVCGIMIYDDGIASTNTSRNAKKEEKVEPLDGEVPSTSEKAPEGVTSKENEPTDLPPELTPLTPYSSRTRTTRRTRHTSNRDDKPPELIAEDVGEVGSEDEIEREDEVETGKTPRDKRSTANSKWADIFSTSNKRKTNANAATTPKRKKLTEVPGSRQSILPFLKPANPTTFESIIAANKNATAMAPSFMTTRSSRGGASTNTAPLFEGYRDQSITSPLAADTASSESSTDEEGEPITTPTAANTRSRDKLTTTTSASVRRREAARKPDRRPTRRGRTTPVDRKDRARQEASSVCAHNQIVAVKNDVARVISLQYAQMEMTRERRAEMLSTRPHDNGTQQVYLRFFADHMEDWHLASEVVPIDPIDKKNSHLRGIKEARIWFQKHLEALPSR